MINNQVKKQTILVTGGTSGLGIEIVKYFLREGYSVVATGRQQINLHGYDKRFCLYNFDFNDLKQVAAITNKICNNHSFSFIVNNAGILSPPEYTETADGFEYTFQINFLAHLLINEIILARVDHDRKISIASVTSPVYRFAALNPGFKTGNADYSAIRSYSSSKLCLAMMSDFLTSRHKELNLRCFSFDPGTFSSGIYRMQKKWFRDLYRVAAPFMRSPAGVAKVLSEIMLSDEIVTGMIYDRSKNQRSAPEMDMTIKANFMNSCYSMIDPFLNRLQAKI